MYKVKRFSYVESLTKGATLLGTLGAATGLVLGKGSIKSAALLGGLGAATGASAGLLGEYDKEIKNHTPKPSPSLSDIINTKIIPNLPREYESLNKLSNEFRSKVIKSDRWIYNEDWTIFIDTYSPQEIAEYYQDDPSSPVPILIISIQNCKISYDLDKGNWYFYDGWGRSPRKVSSIKSILISKFRSESDKYNYDTEYIDYLDRATKFIKSYNIK
jgi:hypothetical protein